MESAGCYFYHVAKTDGMSVWQLIEWIYPATEICPGRMWEDIISIPPERLDSFRAFRGHFMAYLEPFLNRRLTTFTVLRDPVERTISHYCHVRRSPDHPSHQLVQHLSLAEFCTRPETRHMVQNFQAAYLACPARKDPRAVAATLAPEELKRYKLQLSLNPALHEHTAADQLYQDACRRLRAFAAVGITERLDDSLRLISVRLGAGVPPGFGRRNVAPNRPSSLDQATRRIIDRCTEVDHQLYSEQRRQFEDNLAELADSLKEEWQAADIVTAAAAI